MAQTGYEIHGGFTTLQEEYNFLSGLSNETARVDFAEIGRSYGNNPIHLARVALPDPVTATSEGRPTIALLNGIHGNEKGPREGCFLAFRDRLAESTDPDVIAFLQTHIVLFMPSMNPDGIKANIRQNDAGLDLNRGWASLDMPENRLVAGVLRDYDVVFATDGHGSFGLRQIDFEMPTNRNVSASVRAVTTNLIANVLHPAIQTAGYTASWFPSSLHEGQDAKNAWGLRHIPNILVEEDRTMTVQVQTELATLFHEVLLDHIVATSGNYTAAKRAAENEASTETMSLYSSGRWGLEGATTTHSAVIVSPTPRSYLLTAAQKIAVETHTSLWGIEVLEDGINLNTPWRPSAFMLLDGAAPNNIVSATRNYTILSDPDPDPDPTPTLLTLTLHPEAEGDILILGPEGFLDNLPPVAANPIADVTGTAGDANVTINLDTVFSDPDGDTLTYTVQQGTSASIIGSTLTISRANAVSESVIIRATDPGGLYVEDSFAVTVQTAPQPPATAPTLATPNVVSDTRIDLSWSTVSGATGYEYRVNEGTPVDVGSATSAQVTELTAATQYSFDVRAYNGDGPGPWSTARLATTQSAGGSENTAPTFSSTPITSVLEGATYSYNIAATDAEDDVLVLTAPVLPSGLSFVDNGNGTGTLSGTLFQGTHPVTLRVSDGSLTTDQSFTITAHAVNQQNQAPMFVTKPPKAVISGQYYEWQIVGSDPDGDTLTVGASVLPSWLTLVDNGDGTGTLSGVAP